MGSEVLLDYSSIAAALVVAFAIAGAAQGGARTIVIVAASLALIVGLGEPSVASSLLSLGQRVASVLRRAVGAGPAGAIGDSGPYYFAVYLALLVTVGLLAKALVREPGISRSSRLLGVLLGVLNGLLFTLMLREHLLPAVVPSLGSAWDIRIRLQPEVTARALGDAGSLSVGTVAYVFGLLLAGAGILRKVRGARGPGL